MLKLNTLYIISGRSANAVQQYTLDINDEVNITSPNFPSFYPDSAKNNWIFTSSSDNGSFSITFQSFRTMGWPWDFLIIGSGNDPDDSNEVLKIDRFVSPDSTIVVSERHIWMEFVSSRALANVGFALAVTSIGILGKKLNYYKDSGLIKNY